MVSEPENLFVFDGIERAMNTLMLLKLKMDESDPRGALQRYTWGLDEDRTWDGRIVRNCNAVIQKGCQMLGISRLYAVGVRCSYQDQFMDYRSAVTLDRAFHAASEIIDDERKAARDRERSKEFGFSFRYTWEEIARREESARLREEILKDENWQFSGLIHSAWWWRYITRDWYQIRIKHHRVFREYNPAVTLDADIVHQRFGSRSRNLHHRQKR